MNAKQKALLEAAQRATERRIEAEKRVEKARKEWMQARKELEQIQYWVDFYTKQLGGKND